MATSLSDATRRRSQRTFVSGQAVSFIGTEVTSFALPLIGVITLDASASQMGWLTAASMMPHALSPFFAGPLVDASPKRMIMIVADLGRIVLLVAVPVVYALGQLNVAVLAVIAFALGLLSVLFDTAFFAFVPQLAPSDQLLRLNGRLEAFRSGAQTIGPGSAGALVGALGAPLTLLVNAVTFTVSAATVAIVRAEDPKPVRQGGGVKGYARSVGAGFNEVWKRPVLRLLGLGSGAYNLFFAAASTVIAILILRNIGMSPFQYGIALAIGCVGGVLAGFAADHLTGTWGIRTTFCVGLAVASLCNVLIGLLPLTVILAFSLLVLAEFLGTFGATLYIVTNASLRQVLVPVALRGRVYATMRLLNRSAMPAGALLGGWLATATTVRTAVFIAGVSQVVTSLVFFGLRRLLPRSISAVEQP